MRNIVFILVAFLLLGSLYWLNREPAYEAATHNPKILLDGFYSFSSQRHIESQLAAKTLGWKQADQVFAGGGGRPLLVEVTFEVEGYRHLGVTGRLFLSFANDRLWAVAFQPYGITTYLEQLKDKLGTDLAVSGLAARDGVGVVLTENTRGEIQVRWIDSHLSDEQSFWAERQAGF